MLHKKILIASHDKAFADSLKQMLGELEVIKKDTTITLHIASISEFEETHAQYRVIYLDIRSMPSRLMAFVESLIKVQHRYIIIYESEKYAMKTLKIGASYYLKAPIDQEHLLLSVNKVFNYYQLSRQQDMVHEKVLNTKYLTIPNSASDQSSVVQVDKILYVEMGNDLSIYHLNTGEQIISSGRPKARHSIDIGRVFFQLSRKHIVNITKIRAIENTKKEKHQCILLDGTRLPISSRKLTELKKLLGIF